MFRQKLPPSFSIFVQPSSGASLWNSWEGTSEGGYTPLSSFFPQTRNQTRPSPSWVLWARVDGKVFFPSVKKFRRNPVSNPRPHDQQAENLPTETRPEPFFFLQAIQCIQGQHKRNLQDRKKAHNERVEAERPAVKGACCKSHGQSKNTVAAAAMQQSVRVGTG